MFRPRPMHLASNCKRGGWTSLLVVASGRIFYAGDMPSRPDGNDSVRVQIVSWLMRFSMNFNNVTVEAIVLIWFASTLLSFIGDMSSSRLLSTQQIGSETNPCPEFSSWVVEHHMVKVAATRLCVIVQLIRLRIINCWRRCNADFDFVKGCMPILHLGKCFPDPHGRRSNRCSRWLARSLWHRGACGERVDLEPIWGSGINCAPSGSTGKFSCGKKCLVSPYRVCTVYGYATVRNRF